MTDLMDGLLNDLYRQRDELRVEATFWKQATHQALERLLTQEDVSLDLRTKLLEALDLAESNYPFDGYRRVIELRAEVEADNE